MSSNLPGESFNSVIDGQDVNAFAVLHIGARLNRHDIGQADTQVVTDDTVHADLLVGACFVGQDNADRLFASLALQKHCITAEQLQFIHFRLRQ